MAQPPAYSRQFDFSDYQSTAPADPLPGNQVDAELNAVKTTLDATLQNLAAIQRDDGKLRNQSVHPESISNATLSMLNSSIVLRGAWLTATAYAKNDVITQSSNAYLCLVAHTSGTFATDLAAAKWILLTQQGLALDGSSAPAANLPMGGFKFTNLGVGSARSDSVTLGQVQDQAFRNGGTAGGTADALTVSVSPAITSYTAPFTVFFFSGASPNTGPATLNVNSVGGTSIVKNGAALVAGDIQPSKLYAATYHSGNFHLWSPDAARNLYVALTGTQTVAGDKTFSGNNTHSGTNNFTNTVSLAGVGLLASLRGHLAGYTLSNNGADAVNDIDIAAGSAIADDQSAFLVLAAGLTKRLDANWAVGNNQGGLDTGAIANGTYHLFAIRRPDTGVVDVLFSLSATAPTMPANYTQKRRIGAVRRVSNALRAFRQNGDYFLEDVITTDNSTVNPGTSAVTATLSVPVGVVVRALITVALADQTVAGPTYMVVSPLANADSAPTSARWNIAILAGSGIQERNAPFEIDTNTSGQIRVRLDNSTADHSIAITTRGWIDRRGQDS